MSMRQQTFGGGSINCEHADLSRAFVREFDISPESAFAVVRNGNINMGVDDTKEKLQELVECVKRDVIADDLNQIIDINAVLEWHGAFVDEGVDDPLTEALGAQGLDKSIPSKVAKMCAHWEDWDELEPNDIETFECAICDEKLWIVEANETDPWNGWPVTAVNDRGELCGMEHLSDNYSHIYDVSDKYDYVCAHCVRDSGIYQWNDLYHVRGNDWIEYNYKNTVVRDMSQHFPKYTDSWDMSNAKEYVADILLNKYERNNWVDVTDKLEFDKDLTNNNVREMARRLKDDNKVQFDVMLKYHGRGIRKKRLKIYVQEEHVDEMTEWF